jgi:hypothetical protein
MDLTELPADKREREQEEQRQKAELELRDSQAMWEFVQPSKALRYRVVKSDPTAARADP